MIRLDTVNRKLDIQLGSAITTNQLKVVSGYSDNTGTTYMGASATAITNDTTAVTVVNSPNTAVCRDIDFVSVVNEDTVNATVKFYLNDNGTNFLLMRTILATNETLSYTHSQGWKVLDINGNFKNAIITTLADNLNGTPSLPNGTLCTTQGASDNSNKLASTSFVATALSNYTIQHSGSITANIDLGSTPSRSGHFIINGSSFPIGAPIVVTQAVTRPNSTLYDNMEMDYIAVSAIATSATTIQCNWNSKTRVANVYTFNYWI